MATLTSLAPSAGWGSRASTGTEKNRTSLRLVWVIMAPQLFAIVSLTYLAVAPPKETVVLCV